MKSTPILAGKSPSGVRSASQIHHKGHLESIGDGVLSRARCASTLSADDDVTLRQGSTHMDQERA